MVRSEWARAVVVIGACVVGAAANTATAAVVTIPGADFDVTYNTDDLLGVRPPRLAGNAISFRANTQVVAIGGLLPANASLQSATLLLTPKPNMRLEAFQLLKFGYFLEAGGGSTTISGALSVHDADNASNSASRGLTVAKGVFLPELWLGWALIDGTTPGSWTPAAGRSVVLRFENRLEALAPVPFASLAAVTENGVFIGVRAAVIPLPPSVALLAPALLALVIVRRTRQT